MKTMFIVLISLVLLSCNKTDDRRIEEVALSYFCSEMINRYIFLIWNKDEEMVLPPANLPEKFYKNGFLEGENICIKRQVDSNVEPVLKLDRIPQLNEIQFYQEPYQNFELNSQFINCSLDFDTLSLELVKYEDHSSSSNCILVEVKHHVSSEKNKLVEIVYSVEQSEYSIFLFFDEQGEVINWF